LVAVVLYLAEAIYFAAVEMPPTAIEDWFSLFQRSKLLGLFYLNALDIASVALFGPLFLALYVALKRDHESAMGIAALAAFTGIAVFISLRSATLSILPLSDQYAAATSASQRALILAAGQAIGALGQPAPQTSGFLLMAVAVLIISGVMLRGHIFGRGIAYLGSLASIVTFANQLSLVIAPALAGPLLGIAGLLWILWWVLTGGRLLQLGQGG
jgi:hypothetical protein